MALNYSSKMKILTLVLVLTTINSIGNQAVFAQSCCSHGSKGSSRAARASGSNGQPQRTDSPFLAPHGGQLTKTLWNYFEVVYAPQETRVYLFDTFRAPTHVRGIHGTVKMRVRSTGSEFTFPLQRKPGPDGQDYLAARVDLSRVRLGDLSAEFEIGNLPNSVEPTARFTQVYGVLASSPSSIAQTPSDAVAHFTAAPATSGCHCGGKGCCNLQTEGRNAVSSSASCCSQHTDRGVNTAARSDLLAQNPVEEDRHLRPLPPVVDQPVQADEPAGNRVTAQVTVEPVTPADEEAIRLQRVCPVSNQPLGSHGAPIKLAVDGHDVFVCCQGCIEQLTENPEKFLAVVAR